MKLFCLLSFFLMTHFELHHPLHISVMNVEQSKDLNSFEITIKVFTDDIETVIKEQSQVNLHLGTGQEYKDWKPYLEKYFNEKISFYLNASKVALKIQERRVEDDFVWITFMLPISSKVKQIEIKNTLLLDLYYDQTNLLILSYGKKSYTKKMDHQDLVFTIFISEEN